MDVELLFKKQFLKKAQEAFPKKSRAQKNIHKKSTIFIQNFFVKNNLRTSATFVGED